MTSVRGTQGFVMQQRETRLGAEHYKSHADTLTGATPNTQHNQHILTYMPKLLTVEGGGKWSDELLDACDAGNTQPD